MKTALLYAIILILSGFVVYLLLNPNEKEVVVTKIDKQAAQNAIDSLTAIFSDSASVWHAKEEKFNREALNASRKVKGLISQRDELKRQLSDTLTLAEKVEVQTRIIEVQDTIILKQGDRIYSDSVHIVQMKANFESRINLQVRTIQEKDKLLEASEGEKNDLKQKIKKLKLSGGIKTGIIAGLVILIAL